MKNKVLKLCKRLNKVTVSEIAPILMIPEAEAREILNELVKDGSLTVRGGLVYFYNSQKQIKQDDLFLEFHSKYDSKFILKCFCIGIKSEQCAFLIGISDSTIQKYYLYFRKKIYEEQLEKLMKYFQNNPKTPKMRTFYDVEAFLYMYDGKLFVVDKPLKSNATKEHSKAEKSKIKVLYSRLRRSINHSKIKKYMHYHVAEHVLRMRLDNNQFFVVYRNILGIELLRNFDNL